MKKYTHSIIIVLLALSAVAIAQQSPYKGTPWPIPGMIEAEDYDNGGEGVAYHDVDADNHGGAYRPDDGVDLEESSEGHYNIGWIQPDEWVEYSVFVKQSGLYRLDVRVAASRQEGIFHLELDGVDITGLMTAPVTGGWQD